MNNHLPCLRVSREEAAAALNAQIAKGEALLATTGRSRQEYDLARAAYWKWTAYNRALLLKLFDSDELAEEYAPSNAGAAAHAQSLADDIADLVSDVRSDVSSIDSIVGRLDLFDLAPPSTSALPPGPAQKLDHLLSRFHPIARQLRTRQKKRRGLTLKDEYDVQDLLHALLRLDFHDIRAEEWTPSYAGGAARVDFLLKAERIVVEAKMMRTSLSTKALGDELLQDIERYKSVCDLLVCFIYDPEGRILNPTGFTTDLESTVGLTVRVIISPDRP